MITIYTEVFKLVYKHVHELLIKKCTTDTSDVQVVYKLEMSGWHTCSSPCDIMYIPWLVSSVNTWSIQP